MCALRSDLHYWLEAFQAALNMKDASVSSPLKGLPKQKALRKELHGEPWPREHEMFTSLSCDKHKKRTKASSTDEPAKVLSFRTLPDDIDGAPLQNAAKSPSPSPHSELKGLPKKKALHDRHKQPKEKRLYGDVLVPELDSKENGAVQFLGYRTLDT